MKFNSTGVKHGKRSSAQFVQIPYSALAKISKRITNEVSGISRVGYDVTSKPPGTIEWE